MAIYQFYLMAIPRKGVLEKFGKIPGRLEVDHEERKEHYNLKKDGLLEEEDEFKDAMIQDWWSSTELQPMEIIHQIDKKIRRANYGSDTLVNWKFYSKEVDNDAAMSIDEESGKIEKVSFRADLREQSLKFLREMVELAHKYDWLLMDRKGNLVNPDFKEIRRLIEVSNSYKFLKNPLKFLTDLEEGKIEIE